MNNRNHQVRRLTQNALIASCYTVLSLVLAPISFGIGQVRVAESLTLLPAISPHAIWGVTLGCALTNFIGMATGANLLGFADVFIGAFATLIAAGLTIKLRKYRFKGLPVLASIPPILVNAVIIGSELCFVLTGGFELVPLLGFMASVAVGQFVSCTIIGLIMVYAIEKSGIQKYFV